MTWVAEVLTSWNTNSHNWSVISDLLSDGDSAEDMTGQETSVIEPQPNLVIWRAYISDETLTVLEDDDDHVVLTSEEMDDDPQPLSDAATRATRPTLREQKRKNEPPTQTERTKLRAHLQSRSVPANIIGRIEAKSTRRNVTDEVVKYCRTLRRKAGRR